MTTSRRKQRIGTVVSDKMQKSIVVAVAWSIRHPVYKKSMRRVTRFLAHDEEGTARLGDTVRTITAFTTSCGRRPSTGVRTVRTFVSTTTPASSSAPTSTRAARAFSVR